MADQISVWGTVLIMMAVDFKKMAVEFKKFFELDAWQMFPVLSVAENKLCQADSHFEFNVIADKDWNYKDSVQAYYKHCENRHEIGIKESVYEKARNGDRRALISIAHEISHWGLINYFNFNLGLTEAEQLDPIVKTIFIKIHENVVDLLTTLLVFSEEELLASQSAENLDYSSCMGENQISLALFYCQNYKTLEENFIKNILPEIVAYKNQKRRVAQLAFGQKNKLPLN